MKISKYIAACCAILPVMASCSKETPFDGGFEEGTGRLVKSAINMDLHTDEIIVRSGDGINMGDFTISLIAEGSEEPYISYVYSKMPEVIALPAGIYTVKATYGTEQDSGIDMPYFEGESKSFRIIANKITDDIGDVVCNLRNVKVSVLFDPMLVENMSDDTYVSVSLGNGPSVSLTRQHELNDQAAYLSYVEGGTLTLTFNGTVEGWETVETKKYESVRNGTHYKVTFRLHNADPNTQGGADAGVLVDASVTTENVNREVDEGEDAILTDDRRPKEDDKPNEDPNDNPDDPVTGEGPVVTADPSINLDEVNDIVDGMNVVFDVHSETGFIEFTVDIDSTTLTADELEGVGLAQHLDLVNPGQYAEGLEGLGFPINVGGKKDAHFDITDFMPLLTVLGPGNHNFKLTIKDASGTTVKTLKLRTN